MTPSQNFNHLYSDISDSIATAMTEIADLKVEHKEGKKELGGIMERLRNIQTSFDGELELLKQHAEWDKFTMAFFGETNAGKSTIIESLRILFKEESRQQLLDQNVQLLKEYEQALVHHVNLARTGKDKVFAQYATDILATQSLPAIQAISSELEQLLNVQYPTLLEAAVLRENLKTDVHRVDGRIIGTGEPDFTKGNTIYSLNYMGKTFQLIDVPGIEGDEKKYASIVREAIAKAHLVFYVNGTNKKPEKGTAEKIRSYLRRGTQVCPLVNIRGNADAFEFEEDRASLESHGGTDAALKQTMGVLETVLGQEALLPGHCVQGLLAFSSLAINSEKNTTSIHPSRNHDLLIQQRNYLKHFVSAKAMFDFSQVEAIAQVLHTKLGTFREDIIESNKVKVRELLTENIGVLQTTLKGHQTFMIRVEPEFEKCRDAINGAVQTFERLIAAGRKNLWSEFFNILTEAADKIVAEHFGDNDRITEKIKKVFVNHQSTMGARLQAQSKEHMETLQKSLSQAMGRLIQDVRRVEFQQRITFDHNDHKAQYNSTDLDMDLGLKDWGSIALNIGSYALTGAAIGSAFPVIGNLIGAAIGTVVGALVSVMHLFTSKEKRIRKAQAQVQEKIDDVRDQVKDRLSDEVKSLMTLVRKEVQDTTLSQIDAIHISLARPLDIIHQQIALMTHLKNQLEKMPHGTIQTIRR